MRRKPFLIGGGVLILLSVIIINIIPTGPPQPKLTGPMEGPSFTKEGELYFFRNSRTDTLAELDLEIVDQEHEIEAGLMYRTSMPQNAGMLFIFDRMEPRSFWMKNTLIPLDIIYIDDLNRIVTIQANTVPKSERSIPSNKPAQYVLEVNAGYCAQQGIVEGDFVAF